MLPVLYRITFEPLGYALFALLVIAWTASSGWRQATGGVDAKGNELPPTNDDRRAKAINYALVATGVAALGAYYVLKGLPSLPTLGTGKGEGLPLHTYGILVGAGFITAVTASSWLAEREWPGQLGKDRKVQIFDLAFYLFLGGIGGARAVFILVNWKQYAADPLSVLSLSGGLVFQGALVGAAIVAYWYCTKYGIEFLRLMDIGLPTVSLGSAFGRLGCFSAGCCWGRIREAGAKVAVQFPGSGLVKNVFGQSGDTASLAYQSMSDSANETRYFVEATGQVFQNPVEGAVRLSDWVTQHHHTPGIHPTQLYESFAQVLLFALFVFLRRYRRFHGQIAAMWLMVYAVERATVETFRGDAERGTLRGLLKDSLKIDIDPSAWFNISTSQLGSMLIFAAGAALLWRQLSVWRQGQAPQATV